MALHIYAHRLILSSHFIPFHAGIAPAATAPLSGLTRSLEIRSAGPQPERVPGRARPAVRATQIFFLSPLPALPHRRTVFPALPEAQSVSVGSASRGW